MKIAFTADLHLPITTENQIREVANNAVNSNVDIVAIGGDVGESRMGIDNFRKCLQIFRDVFSCPIVIVPGNHDLWADTLEANSMELLNRILPQQTKTVDAVWLETDNYIIGDVAFVGSYLHYDYSCRDKVGPTALYPEEFIAANKINVINDRLMRGVPSDKEFAKQLGAAFSKRLETAQSDPTINKIVILTHVPCMECQITRDPFNFQWSLSTPYFGNLSHQKQIEKSDKVKLIVSGHSHQRNYNQINGIDVHTLGSHYGAPEILLYDLI